MSWRTRLVAAAAGGAAAVLVLLALLVAEMVLLGIVLNRSAPSGSGTVTWDPVSLWRSGFTAKAWFLLAICIPVISSVLAGKALYARILHR